MIPGLLDTEKAAKFLGMSPGRVRQLVADGSLIPANRRTDGKKARQHYFSEAQLVQYQVASGRIVLNIEAATA